MASQLGAGHSSMATAVGHITETANIVKGIQTQVNTSKETLRRAWDGSSAISFDAVHHAWDQEMGRVIRALEKFAMDIHGSKIQYEGAQEQAEKATNQLAAILNYRP
ncbi:WXG100 family type VII secretion target [Bailinhaonella thermotolerans]|uniref:ESAT-6-like protein n=1 Tax=Bailinhaonella thermotolerans TaxID=1070861 RepID=A0A3A4AVW6_9ACTN|nr:WXG100 family type VII secretion target [Bailinhaonella thermotolerans]RJL30023.1 hypothetical protein D5H75_24090 [Bailinhaonella thermotolerans]